VLLSYWIVLFEIQTVEVLVDILCLCSLAKSKTTVVLVDEKRLRTPILMSHEAESEFLILT
jgi:hypothetical protein